MQNITLAVRSCKDHGVEAAICIHLGVDRFDEWKGEQVMVTTSSVELRYNPDVLVDLVTFCHERGLGLKFVGNTKAVIDYLPKPLARRMGMEEDTTAAEKVVSDMFPDGTFVHNKE